MTPGLAQQPHEARSDTERAAKLIAAHLASGLRHPGDEDTPSALLRLPGFSTAGMNPRMAEVVATANRQISEAIIATLADHGLSIINTAQLQQYRAQDPDTPPPHTTDLICPHGKPIATIAAVGRLQLSASQLESLRCQHG